MAWSTPLTAVANAVLTAAQWNATVRDNLNETAPAKATTAGQIFVSTGVNAIAARTIKSATVLTLETTASSSFAALTTAGPVVTATTGTQAIVVVTAQASNNTANGSAVMGYSVSGATTVAATDDTALQNRTASGSNEIQRASALSVVDLTPGSNTFTSLYHQNAVGVATFAQRSLVVIPL